jgi:uncharacterized membrane protein (UPF0136 family)
MIQIAAVSALLTGLVAILGGIQGFLKARSRPSLVAGLVTGDLLVIGSVLALLGWTWALWITALTAAALMGRFLPAWLRDTAKFWPAFVMAALSAVTLVLSVAARIA